MNPELVEFRRRVAFAWGYTSLTREIDDALEFAAECAAPTLTP
ncbi:hypothetical protein AB0F88_39695 [Streptosporangium sp. NPDC023963]